MVRVPLPLYLVVQCVAFLGQKHVVDTDERPQAGIRPSHALAGLDERVLVAPLQLLIGIRHRGVIKVSGDDGLNRGVADVIKDYVHLLGTAGDGVTHLFLRLQDLSILSAGECLDQAGDGQAVTLEMAVIYAYNFTSDVQIGVMRLVGTLLEIELPLSHDGETAQDDVTEIASPRYARIMPDIVPGHDLGEILLYPYTLRPAELLEADDIGVNAPNE